MTRSSPWAAPKKRHNYSGTLRENENLGQYRNYAADLRPKRILCG